MKQQTNEGKKYSEEPLTYLWTWCVYIIFWARKRTFNLEKIKFEYREIYK